MKNAYIDNLVDELQRAIIEEAKWCGLMELVSEGYNITANPPSSSLTDKANAASRWSVVRTRAPFCTEDGIRLWSGPTPQAAYDKARKDFAKDFKL